MPGPRFVGHQRIAESLWRMVSEDRLPQTLLFAGKLGIGKATLARHLAAGMNCASGPGKPCGECSACIRILEGDLSSEQFRERIEARRKLSAEKRKGAPLVVATHPDVLIFPPDGPMQLLSIDQARMLRESARLAPAEGRRRIFVLEHADRATDEASNALLKTLEEPAASLTIVLTSENPFALLPTIRSRAIPFYFSPLARSEMDEFMRSRDEVAEKDRALVSAWAEGSPGAAIKLDMEEFVRRRHAMLALLRAALKRGEFAKLSVEIGSLGRGESGQIDRLAAMLHSLLRDLLLMRVKAPADLVHHDIAAELEPLARRVNFAWLERAVVALQELEQLQRLNVQKQIAFEAYALKLQR